MQKLLYLHLALGLWLAFIGLGVSVRPHLALDVVLTQEELKDHTKKDATLALLQKGAGNDSAMMFVTGIVLSSTSLLGVKLLKRHQKNTPPSLPS